MIQERRGGRGQRRVRNERLRGGEERRDRASHSIREGAEGARAP